MGHYLSEMPDIETAAPSLGSQQLREWVEVAVGVLEDYGRPMKQDELEKLTAKILGISVIRMPYVITNAIADKRMKRGGPGRYSVLELA